MLKGCESVVRDGAMTHGMNARSVVAALIRVFGVVEGAGARERAPLDRRPLLSRMQGL